MTKQVKLSILIGTSIIAFVALWIRLRPSHMAGESGGGQSLSTFEFMDHFSHSVPEVSNLGGKTLTYRVDAPGPSVVRTAEPELFAKGYIVIRRTNVSWLYRRDATVVSIVDMSGRYCSVDITYRVLR
jgi:hypothetical protein